jgi:hypothetical protein
MPASGKLKAVNALAYNYFIATGGVFRGFSTLQNSAKWNE